MDIEKVLGDLLERENRREEEAQKAAQKAAEDEARKAAEARFATKEDLQAALTAFGEQIAKTIGEEVAKALPVQRPEGAGRVGEQSGSEEDPFQADPVAHVAKKAASERTAEEKAFIWAMTRKALAPEQLRIA